MAKYDKYFTYKIPPKRAQNKRQIAYVDYEDFPDANQVNVHWVTFHPDDEGKQDWGDYGHGPHEHKNPEMIIHMGTDPDNKEDLGGEVELAMGPELIRYHITKSCIVFLPAGFIHSPWIVRRVTRPFLVVTICQEIEHTEKPHPELLTEAERKKMMFIYEGYGKGKAKERRVVASDRLTVEGKLSELQKQKSKK
jgi:hypothetical protein